MGKDVSYSPVQYFIAGMSFHHHHNSSRENGDAVRQGRIFIFDDERYPGRTKSVNERLFVSIGFNHDTFKNVGFNSMMISPAGKGWESPTNSSYWYDKEMVGSAAAFGDGFEKF